MMTPGRPSQHPGPKPGPPTYPSGRTLVRGPSGRERN
jgi:hypothetical protein